MQSNKIFYFFSYIYIYIFVLVGFRQKIDKEFYTCHSLYWPIKRILTKSQEKNNINGGFFFNCTWFSGHINTAIYIIVDHTIIMIPENIIRCLGVLYNLTLQSKSRTRSEVAYWWPGNFRPSF